MAALTHRVRLAARRPAAWLELVRFATVGASGYVVNLAVFTLSVHGFDLGYRAAAVVAFAVAVANNFAWNRHWTFRARASGRAHHQAARFLTVSLAGLGVNLVLLELFVAVAGLAEVPAQALAIACATPLTFVGNKLWTFRSP